MFKIKNLVNILKKDSSICRDGQSWSGLLGHHGQFCQICQICQIWSGLLGQIWSGLLVRNWSSLLGLHGQFCQIWSGLLGWIWSGLLSQHGQRCHHVQVRQRDHSCVFSFSGICVICDNGDASYNTSRYNVKESYNLYQMHRSLMDSGNIVGVVVNVAVVVVVVVCKFGKFVHRVLLQGYGNHVEIVDAKQLVAICNFALVLIILVINGRYLEEFEIEIKLTPKFEVEVIQFRIKIKFDLNLNLNLASWKEIHNCNGHILIFSHSHILIAINSLLNSGQSSGRLPFLVSSFTVEQRSLKVNIYKFV